MNERIEAYLKQHYCRDYFNRYGETVEDDYYFMYREEVDGLIELIVRECIARVEGCAVEFDDNHPNDQFIAGYNKGVSKTASQVKQHFGFAE